MTVRFNRLTRHAGRAVSLGVIWASSVSLTERPQLVAPRIIVRPRGLVSADAPDLPHAEPWLAVDPRNASRAIAVALAGNGGTSVAYTTVDEGRTWTRSKGSTPDGRFPGGDPVVAFTDDGTAILATISPFRVWRTPDGGATWLGPILVPGRSFDREYLAIRSVPNANDTLYAVAKTPIKIFGHMANDALALTRSADMGATFEGPRLLLPDPTKSIIHVPGGLAVLPNGDLVLSFMAHDVPVVDAVSLRNHIWVIRSTDGGPTFSQPVAATESVVHGNAGDELKMLKSLAGARLVADTASRSPYRGRLYLSYLTVVNDRLQVMLVSSTDTGRTWGGLFE